MKRPHDKSAVKLGRGAWRRRVNQARYRFRLCARAYASWMSVLNWTVLYAAMTVTLPSAKQHLLYCGNQDRLHPITWVRWVKLTRSPCHMKWCAECRYEQSFITAWCRDLFRKYDTIGEFNVDSKAEYSALSSTRSQKKKLKQTTPVPLNNASDDCDIYDEVASKFTLLSRLLRVFVTQLTTTNWYSSVHCHCYI